MVRTFRRDSLSNFQVYNTVLLTIVGAELEFELGSDFRACFHVRQQLPTCIQAHRNPCSRGTLWVDVSLENILDILDKGKVSPLSLPANTCLQTNKPICYSL